MADCTDDIYWTDNTAQTPPGDWTGTDYITGLGGAGSTPGEFPFTYNGPLGYLTGTFEIAWTYDGSRGQDAGLYINYSINGGATWVSTQVVVPGTFAAHNGNFDIPLAGATGLMIQISTAAHP